MYNNALRRRGKKWAQQKPIHIILPGGKVARTRAEKVPDSKAYLLSVVDQ